MPGAELVCGRRRARLIPASPQPAPAPEIMLSLIRKLTHALNCRDATRLVSQRQDRPLTTGEWFTLRLHLLVCVACSRFARQLRIMRKAMRRYTA